MRTCITTMFMMIITIITSKSINTMILKNINMYFKRYDYDNLNENIQDD